MSLPLGLSSTTSFAAIGMLAGMVIPGVGMLVGYAVGAIIGGITDLINKSDQLKAAEKQMTQDFYAEIAKRYSTQMFSSCVEELGAAMLYVEQLGFKPSTPEFEAMLQKKLSTGNCIYTGNCGINIFGLSPNVGTLQALATINSGGKLTPYTPNVDLKLGPQWIQACHDLNTAAYTAWAQDYENNVLFEQQLSDQQTQANRDTITRIFINVGLMMLMFGYIVREESKVAEIRTFKAKSSTIK